MWCSKVTRQRSPAVHSGNAPRCESSKGPVMKDKKLHTMEQSTRKQKEQRSKKNAEKALRFSWRCLLLGLQSFAAGYSAPVSAAAAAFGPTAPAAKA
ncbi:hypothetical protein JZ751_018829 [Albula glossodonta]|uniref:Uncharacterized protein n=1 Tax=Albula glossodonta TaxID=121402 RepID=A0A8T2MVG4_9TELE|nr:hypothetical protein JZ751_018829 [Albula glossodonta]